MAFTNERLSAYFERIGYGGSCDKTSKTLSDLQDAHLQSIPYENIDILLGVPLSLDEDDLFEKMVVKKRGGYCFEQNGLLLAALEGIGFEVTQLCGRFIIGEVGISDRRHRVLKVEASDGTFICDVGVYGESPRKVLRFVEGEVQSDGICEYKYRKDDFYGWVECQKQRGKDWTDIYGFTEEPWLTRDFLQPSFFCEKHPESAFTSFHKVGMFRDKATLTFIDHTFTIYEDAQIKLREEIEDKDIPKLLKEQFGLVVDNASMYS